MERLHHVFLSYSHEDLTLMQRIRDDLRAEGLTVWTDEVIPPNSPDWTLEIENGIRGTGCVVVLLSPDAAKSHWVREELDFARKQGKPIFPVLARGEDADVNPLWVWLAQYIDLRNDYPANFQKLLKALCAHLDIESKSQREARLAHEEAERLRLEEEEVERQQAERERREQEKREKRRQAAIARKQAQALEEQRQREEAELAQRQARQAREAEQKFQEEQKRQREEAELARQQQARRERLEREERERVQALEEQRRREETAVSSPFSTLESD